MTAKTTKEEIDELKELYEKAKKEYDLPAFDELDKEFELRKIEDGFIIREVRRKILDKIHAFVEWIAPVVNPSSQSIHSMIEAKLFNKTELDEIFNFYKKIHYYIHKGLVAGLQTEKDEADFIKEVWKVYPELKKEIAKHMEKIAKGWAEAEEESITDDYHG